MSKSHELDWKIYTPGLLKEILSNNETQVLRIPLIIFAGILNDVAARASQLNDVILNQLMMKLALYEVADPKSKAYDPKLVSKYIKRAHKTNKNLGEHVHHVRKLKAGSRVRYECLDCGKPLRILSGVIVATTRKQVDEYFEKKRQQLDE
jgi:hypothetical protein